MLRVKENVIFRTLRPEIYKIFEVIEDAWSPYGVDPVITSAADGIHKRDSFHYRDLAIDLRSKTLPTAEAKVKVLTDLRHELGPEYDVLFENEGEENEHFHLEYEGRAAA